MQKRAEVILFVLLLSILVALEATSAFLARETMGEITGVIYWFAIGLNVVFVALAFKYRAAAIVGMLLLALAIVPYQFGLAHRLWRVQNEAVRIVAYAYEQRLATNEFPADLGNYKFRDTDTQSYIQEYRVDKTVGGFRVCYFVGTISTSHCYSPINGWTYYPD